MVNWPKISILNGWAKAKSVCAQLFVGGHRGSEKALGKDRVVALLAYQGLWLDEPAALSSS